jgi:hypothetical protein
MAKKQIKKYVFEPGVSKDDNLLPNAVALLIANKAFLQAQVVAFINDQIANDIAPYEGYTYASSKCSRDVGYFIDAVINDLRYGGNVKCRQVADYFWIDGEPQIRGDVSPEITGQAYLRDVINNFIFTNTTVTPAYGQVAIQQVKYVGSDAEPTASSRNTSLWSVFSTVISQGTPYMPAKIPGVSSLRLIGKYDPTEILLITNTNTGQILYNFADENNSLTVEYKTGRSSGDGELLSDVDFVHWWHTSDTITTVKLSVDTSTLQSSADIQIFVEEPSQQIRPWEFGTDAIERMRVAQPQAMLDADFEYGLQPTKWQALGLIRGYPSIFEIPGTDLSVVSITTDASSNTGYFGSSLITVTTSGTHGFSAQQPITVKGLSASVGGFARAEGSFLVYSVPSSVSFTYYASAKVGTLAGESLYTSFVQVRQAGFYTGASIGQPTFSVYSNGTNLNILSKFDTTVGAFTIAFDGTAPTPGSPISGSPAFTAGTSVSGVVGTTTVSAHVKNTVESATDTSITVVDTTGIQQSMALESYTGTALFVNSLAGNTLYLSGQLGQTFVGANGTNTGVSGTNIQGTGVGATFNVSRSAGAYTITDSGDSASNGQNYAVGDRIVIAGTDLGGASPTNDVILAVTGVDSGGSITAFNHTGTSITGGGTYTAVPQSLSDNIGIGATITVVREGGTGAYTISLVDGGSDHAQGDTVTWYGTSFGGSSPANDIVIQVDGVTAGAIVDYTIIGTPVGDTGNAAYTSVAGTNQTVSGTSAVFTVTRTDGLYSAVATSGGTGYQTGNRILISGNDLDGTSPINDCILTVTGTNGDAINLLTASGTPYDGDTITVYPTLTISEALNTSLADGSTLNVGAIPTIQVDFNSNHGLVPGTTILTSISSTPAPGFTATNRTLSATGSWTGVSFAGGTWVAVKSGSTDSARSIDGQTWSAGGALPSSTTWTSTASGSIGGTVYHVAIASGGTAAAYSINGGQVWTAATLPSSSTWSSVTYYNEAFVAIASGGTAAAYSLNGTTWTAATLPSSGTWSDVTGGLIGTSAYFVAVASGGTAAAYSVDNGATWTATGALPASTTWSTIAFGNNRFLAVARATTTAAYSTNGTTWTSVALPTSANWNCSAFGDDSFLIIADGGTQALTSFSGETGSWVDRTLSATSTWEEVAYGNLSGIGRFAVVGATNAAMSIDLQSANHQLATGPHVVTQVPSATSIRYPARTTGTINTTAGLTGVLYARPDSFFTHRPFDGGVQLGTGNPSHGAQAIRQSKKYIRYQSGKGMMYTTGGLFAPSYNLSSAIALNTEVNSIITFTCDDTDHGLQPGAEIEIIGMVSFEFNGDYIVESIVDARSFRVRSHSVLSSTSGSLGTDSKVVLKRWHGATVRIGAFDEQNGLFYQYDGQEMAVVKRSSTNQLSGTVSVNIESNAVTGIGTRFQDQLKVGDKVVLRGMSHIVTSILNQTQLTFAPDWRGANSIVGARLCITQDLIIKQSDWNMDPIDGTGPSGYNMLPWRMQMLGMQYSWYAAGFIEWMLRGPDGKFVFLHRLRNSNVNTEAYMRTANLPVRYEVENASAKSKLVAQMSAGQNTMSLTDASRFPTTGIVYVDNELISYSGKTGNTLTGCTRAASMTAFTAGQNRTFTAGSPSIHLVNSGVSLVSCTTSPTISHWGSALLIDGMFDSDRGYIFNYAGTGLSISTSKQTAFMIRLAPSVSNALVGDLGERDLLNRAQLLLNEIGLTADSGTGAIVVEGILNPKNYPTDPTKITWTGLSSQAAGGQPSFAQIALGGSINWGGVGATTSTATVQGALTTSLVARSFSTVTNNVTAVANPSGVSGYALAIQSGRSDFLITNAQYDALLSTTPMRVGDSLAATTYITGGQTITSITRAYQSSNFTQIVMSSPANVSTPPGNTGTVAVSASTSISYARAFSVGRNDFLVTDSDYVASYAANGDSISVGSYLVAGQTIVSSSPGYALVSGVSYTRVVVSTAANATSNAGSGNNVTTTVTASGTASSYASTNYLFFNSASWNASGASVGTRVATSFTQFPAGTAVSAVTTRRLGTTTVIRATFTQNSNATIAAAATATFQFGDPQYALPGEQVFSFVANPGNTTSLDLTELKELTTTAIGGRGAFPNGPDVLAINIYKVTGTATPGSVILRWGEAQA